MTQFVSTSNQANNVTIQRDHLVESQKIFFRNRTKPLVVLILPHLFSHLSFFIFIWKIWLQRERERESRGWIVESSFPMQFHSPRPFLLLLSLLALVYPGRFVRILHLPSSNASLLPVFIPCVSFPAAEAFIRMLFSYVHTCKMFHGKKGRVHNPGYRREYKADSTIL